MPFVEKETEMLVFAREVPEGAGFLDKDKGSRLLSYSLPVETIAVSINGKGQVGFLGTGGELGGSATLTLSFKRG